MVKKRKDLLANVTEKAFKLGKRAGKKQIKKSPSLKQIKRDNVFDVKIQTGARKSIIQQSKVLSQEQSILNGMFGGGVGKRVLGDTRPRINRTLQGGNQPFGLIKNGDGGYTASLMLPTKMGGKTI